MADEKYNCRNCGLEVNHPRLEKQEKAEDLPYVIGLCPFCFKYADGSHEKFDEIKQFARAHHSRGVIEGVTDID